MIELIRSHRDVKLLVDVENCVRLVAYQPGRIEFQPTEDAPRDLAAKLGSRLQAWTGNRWAVTLVGTGGGATLAEDRDAEEAALRDQAATHPLVQAVLSRFPEARIVGIRTPDALQQEAELEALPEVDEEWDPFEEE